jgi:hypothetical protein
VDVEKTFKIVATIVWFSALVSCNMSDYSQELPGGHTYDSEGRCYKKILLNIGDIPDIESCVSEYKYDDDFITVSQVDTAECNRVGLENSKSKRYYIINVHKESVLGPLDRKKFEIEFERNKIEDDLYIQ